ncbi:MAG: rRNA maturation RNase YbeY [Ignavibacteria bacterium GWA2_35_9]|nr:MAG: rRNA maturation RNase YbeY [Ignavibacteria bacterium GWA2_35_9]OGU46425.1 MAG: rRNA maturation RNase YbeY [Ignavibacteria bacterium GWB2_36_8]OGU53607.1 MAG: rRNA maturation RNase YbeY [Ignavibacteria bacterium GWC2_36_12]
MKNLSVNYRGTIKIDKSLIHKIVKKLTEDLNFKISSMQINFVNSNEMTRINSKYLNHNYSTDIITFNYSETKNELDGEIYISIDDAASNSKKFRVTFIEEVLRIVIHGFLHLLGYDDKGKKDKLVMKRLENSLFNQYRLLLKN